MNQIISIRWVLIPKFSELTGYTEKAIHGKIDNGHWIEGIQWCKSPDGRRQINIDEYIKWVESEVHASQDSSYWLVDAA